MKPSPTTCLRPQTTHFTHILCVGLADMLGWLWASMHPRQCGRCFWQCEKSSTCLLKSGSVSTASVISENTVMWGLETLVVA